MNRIGLIMAVVLLIGAVGVGTWYYVSHGNKESSSSKSQASGSKSNNSSQSSNGNSSQSPSSDGKSAEKTYPVSVYFSKHPNSDDDPSAVFPVSRTSQDLGVATFSITELLKGPTATETQQGYFSTARLRGGTGTDDFKLTIANGKATLQFLKLFDHLGVVADGQAESELNATLKQFPSVQKVVIINASGDCEFNLSGLNKCLE